eukprot:4896876-Prymnesium_polylepis.1
MRARTGGHRPLRHPLAAHMPLRVRPQCAHSAPAPYLLAARPRRAYLLAPRLHRACTAPAPHLHRACTAPALHLHRACTAPAPRLLAACLQPAVRPSLAPPAKRHQGSSPLSCARRFQLPSEVEGGARLLVVQLTLKPPFTTDFVFVDKGCGNSGCAIAAT